MTQNNSKELPLWLDLKEEYIDDNFQKLLEYLQQQNSTVKDSFYSTTLSLLGVRCQSGVDELTSKSIFKEYTEDKWIFISRLIAAQILCEQEPRPLLYLCLVDALMHIVPERHFFDLEEVAINALTSKEITAKGFSWTDIAQNFLPETFAFKLTQNFAVSSKKADLTELDGLGFMCIENGDVVLGNCNYQTWCDQKNAYSTSLKVAEDRIRIVSHQRERLKEGDSTRIDTLKDFAKFYIQEMQNVKQSRKKQYSAGDEVLVRVVSNRFNVVKLESVEPKYEKISGLLDIPKNPLYYYSNTIFENLHEGDVFYASLTEKGTFEIFDQFVDHIVQMSKSEHGYGSDILAMRIDCRNGKTVWLTEFGVPVYVENAEDCNNGDMAMLNIKEYKSGRWKGYIAAEFVEFNTEYDFEEKDVRSNMVRLFASKHKAPVAQDDTLKKLDGHIPSLLSDVLFQSQRALASPVERYKVLLVARLFKVLTGDVIDSDYISFFQGYIEILVRFACGESIEDKIITPNASFAEADDVIRRLNVIDIIKEYGRKDDSPLLSDFIHRGNDDLLVKMASLIQSSNRIQELVTPATLKQLKREITKMLAVESENETDFEEDGSIFVGHEDQTHEFKHSFVFPPDNNMQASPTTQKNNIFKGLCGFLNSHDGGTLYLGVNDSGHVEGLDNDFKYLKCGNMDTYIRHIQDAAKKDFGIEVLTCIHFESLYDDKVVAVHCDPYPYGIVELEGNAYIRLNNESRLMNEGVRRITMSKKSNNNDSTTRTITALDQAISKHRQVCLHRYSSNNSGEVRDRLVEPHTLFPDANILFAYEIESGKNKAFKLPRIGSVEILSASWSHEKQHERQNIDIFRMTGTKPIHISLQLDLMARNLLVEEYPTSAGEISGDKNDGNIFYLDTDVYSMNGVGRFYVGLAEHIQVIEGMELLQWTKEYLNKIKEKL